jgi:hypothetical protein
MRSAKRTLSPSCLASPPNRIYNCNLYWPEWLHPKLRNETLSTVWRDGEVRPTHRKRSGGPRTYRTRVDPFAEVWPQVQQWLNEQPDANAKDLFLRLRETMPDTFPPGQLRTLQRRVRQWRTEIARKLVLGLESETETERVMCSAGPEIRP